MAPEGAEPRAELALALLARHRQGPSAQALREAEAEAQSAVALAPDLARAHLARADVALQARYDWDGAEAGYRAALRLDPGLAPAWSGYAALLAASGRFDDAIAAAERARELDPVCMAASADLGRYLFLARRYDEAIVASREALALDPRHTLAHLTIIHAFLERNDEGAALAQANAHLAAYFAGGDRPAPRARHLRDYWRGSVAYLSSTARKSYLPPSDLALLELELGEVDDGLRLLLRGCEEHAGRELLFAAVDPRLDAWRRDPRLHRVIACLGLDEARSS
jgi:tetratricopeptide (TPR) repeat protein